MKIETVPVGDRGVPLTAYVLDFSAEMASAAIRPGVLILPGGGYFMTSDREAEPVAMAYLAEGYNAFVLRYSTGADTPFEVSYADGVAGLEYIREHAREYAIDPEHVAVVGFSAGGHLASCLGTVYEHAPSALILGYPVTMADLGARLGKALPDTADAVTPATPPTFVYATSDDAVVPIENSLRFCTALARHGVPFELHIYPHGEHGLSLAKPLTAGGRAGMVNTPVQAWVAASVRFLKEQWGDYRAA